MARVHWAGRNRERVEARLQGQQIVQIALVRGRAVASVLAVRESGAEHWHASILACPETYCDYVLVLGQREPLAQLERVNTRGGVDDRLRAAG